MGFSGFGVRGAQPGRGQGGRPGGSGPDVRLAVDPARGSPRGGSPSSRSPFKLGGVGPRGPPLAPSWTRSCGWTEGALGGVSGPGGLPRGSPSTSRGPTRSSRPGDSFVYVLPLWEGALGSSLSPSRHRCRYRPTLFSEVYLDFSSRSCCRLAASGKGTPEFSATEMCLKEQAQDAQSVVPLERFSLWS